MRFVVSTEPFLHFLTGSASEPISEPELVVPAEEPPPVVVLSKQDKRRYRNLHELLETERNYIDSLRKMNDIFIAPLHPGAKAKPSSSSSSSSEEQSVDDPVNPSTILTPNQVQVLSAGILNIVRINEEFLKVLEEIPNLRHSASQDEEISNDVTAEMISTMANSVAQIFLRRSATFKLYISYISSYEGASRLVVELMQSNEQFKEFCQRCNDRLSNENSRVKTIQGFLVMPVQRLPKYQVLLEELLKNTTETAVEFASISSSLKQISEITLYCNEKKKELENTLRVIELRNELKIKNLVQPHRKFVREGELQSVNSKGDQVQANLYLFNDLFVCTKPRRGVKLPKTYKIPLGKQADVVLKSDVKPDEQAFVFSMMFSKKTLTFHCVSKKQLEDWIFDLESCTGDPPTHPKAK